MRFIIEAAEQRTGVVHRWEIDAPTIDAAERQAQDAGYYVHSVTPAQAGARVVIQPQATKPRNPLGIAGMVLSILGLLCFGLLAPVGAVVSFVGLFYEPQGEATAGVVIGVLGTGLWLALGLMYVCC